jgi:multiple sugar transport system substrate-binding protein
MRKFTWILAAITAFTVLLTGCNSRDELPLEEKEDAAIQIGYLSEEAFENRYANVLQREYPKLRYDIVPMLEVYRGRLPLSEWLRDHPVDLLYVPSHLFQTAIDEAQLRPLEPLMEQTGYSIENRVPAVVELTKLYGNGSLYGLPPYFSGRALAYNRELFDQAGVDYPKDGMSWESLLEVASRFPQGLSLTDRDPWDWIRNMGSATGLRVYDAASGTPAFNAEAWLPIWQKAMRLIETGGVTFDDINDKPFLRGERAMAVIDNTQLRELEQPGSTMRWELVTMPANPAKPDYGPDLGTEGFFAIPQAASVPDDAWEVMRFLLSERVEKWVASEQYGLFSTLTSQLGLNEQEKQRRAVFHRLRPSLPDSRHSLPDGLREMAAETARQLVEGKQPIDQSVLDKLQEQAERWLQTASALED